MHTTMGVLAWLKRAILYIQLKFHYGLFNLIIKFATRKRLQTFRVEYPSQYITIAGVNGHGRLGIFLHSPPPTDPAHDKLGPRPVHINYHGGGYALDMHGFDARWCAFVAAQLGCYVVDADYRMAPDHPFPAAYDDAGRVLDWVRANEAGMFDPSRITLGGLSAGASLAMALAGTVEPPVQGVLSFYAPLDWTVPYHLKPAPPKADPPLPKKKGMVIPPAEGEKIAASYLLNYPPPQPREFLMDPRLSPRFAPPEKFPGGGRTMILSCEYDYLDAESRELLQVLEEAGREPVGVWVEGMGHGFDQFCADGSEEAAVRDVNWQKAIEVLRKAYALPESA
ncbi:alpha/beta-hydrolase [Calocera cornea HHB12733]|uniref:Alpha/beta-hydrolase n=1 Tax=Calocera cornea HHB12733 TaxID=1353952 RepID=A0A165DMI6_9BASI|nr:alpha/beta-hydrolase [Calocera cornea HHB12733]